MSIIFGGGFRLIMIVARIKDIRWAYLLHNIGVDEYASELEQLWVSECVMAKKETLIRTGLIASGDMTFDFDEDMGKELEAVAKAKEMGLISSAVEVKPS